MELIQLLIQNLGVREDQAKGGVGLLFKLAKEKLGGGDFSKIAELVPGIEDMMKLAPQVGGGAGGLIGKLASVFGGGSKLGSIASLASGFSELGMDSSMIGKFSQNVLSFVQSKGGDDVKDLLEKALK